MKLRISDSLAPRVVVWLFKVIAIATFAATNLSAGILYDRSQDALVVTGFPSDVPCSPLTLALADKMNGWGKASYDKASGNCVVDAVLIIGEHCGSDTWFRIGSADHPAETLVAKKGLTVFPAFVKGLNPESDHRLAKKGRNVLVLGVPDNPAVKATLRLGPGSPFSIGFLESMPDSLQYGGGLQVYNSAITAEDESPAKRFGGDKFVRFPRFSEIILKNASISRFKGEIYGLGDNTSVDKCSFSEGLGVIIEKITLKGCVFERMEEAVHDFGGLDATLVNCVFKNNKRNFNLRYNHGVTCIDCDFGTATAPDILKSFSRSGKTVNPQILSRRHVTIFVSDVGGKPLAGARVTVAGGLKPMSEITGANGTLQILLDEFLVKATEAKPETTLYTYTITAAKDGKTAVRTEYRPCKGGTDIQLELK